VLELATGRRGWHKTPHGHEEADEDMELTPVSAVPVSPAVVSAIPVSPAPVSAIPVSPSPVSAIPVSPAPVSAVPVSPAPIPDEAMAALAAEAT
jgi:hypothetical protein